MDLLGIYVAFYEADRPPGRNPIFEILNGNNMCMLKPDAQRGVFDFVCNRQQDAGASGESNSRSSSSEHRQKHVAALAHGVHERDRAGTDCGHQFGAIRIRQDPRDHKSEGD